MAMTRHGKHWPKAEDHDDEPESTPAGEHTHRQPRIVLMGLTVAVVVLLLANGLTLIYGVSVNTRLGQLEEYVAGRGVQRDAENQQLQQDISDAVCNVLDSLPAGGLFDPIRAQYGCGPGIPVEQLDPAAAQNLAEIIEQGTAAPILPDAPSEPTEAAPTPAGPTPPSGAVITPSVPSPTSSAPAIAAPPAASSPAPAPAPAPAPVTPAPAPAAPTTPAPIADLSGVTDAVCGLLRVCI